MRHLLHRDRRGDERRGESWKAELGERGGNVDVRHVHQAPGPERDVREGGRVRAHGGLRLGGAREVVEVLFIHDRARGALEVIQVHQRIEVHLADRSGHRAR